MSVLRPRARGAGQTLQIDLYFADVRVGLGRLYKLICILLTCAWGWGRNLPNLQNLQSCARVRVGLGKLNHRGLVFAVAAIKLSIMGVLNVYRGKRKQSRASASGNAQ